MGGTTGSGGHGVGSVILATSDGGVTWTAQESGPKDGLDSVSFVDDTHGWAVGRNTALVFNSPPSPTSSVLPRIGFIAAAVVVLGILLGLVLVLRSRRRRAGHSVGSVDSPPSGLGAQSPVAVGASAAEGGEDLRYCAACGSAMDPGSTFCTSCGARVVR